MSSALWRRRIIVGTIVVLAHGLGVYALFVARGFLHAPRVVGAAPPLIWLALPNTTHAPTTGALLFSLVPPKLITLPPLDFSTALTFLPAEQPDPALTALRDYLACTGPGTKPVGEAGKHCDDVLRALKKMPLAEHIPTEKEKALERQFKREKAFGDAPITLPCFPPTPFTPLCLIAAAAKGDLAAGSYALPSRPGAVSPPQRGVTGIPDLSKGMR